MSSTPTETRKRGRGLLSGVEAGISSGLFVRHGRSVRVVKAVLFGLLEKSIDDQFDRWPHIGLQALFDSVNWLDKFSVIESSLGPESGSGLRCEESFKKGEVLGMIGGCRVDAAPENHYGIQIQANPRVIVDGLPTGGKDMTMFGRMNDPYNQRAKYNCKISRFGVVIATRDIKKGEELFVEYPTHDWDHLKIHVMRDVPRTLQTVARHFDLSQFEPHLEAMVKRYDELAAHSLAIIRDGRDSWQLDKLVVECIDGWTRIGGVGYPFSHVTHRVQPKHNAELESFANWAERALRCEPIHRHLCFETWTKGNLLDTTLLDMFQRANPATNVRDPSTRRSSVRYDKNYCEHHDDGTQLSRGLDRFDNTDHQLAATSWLYMRQNEVIPWEVPERENEDVSSADVDNEELDEAHEGSESGLAESFLAPHSQLPINHAVNPGDKAELRVYSWNCNSIALRIGESLKDPSRLKLEFLLRWMKRDSPDVVVLIDTRATNTNIDDMAVILKQRFKGTYRLHSVPVEATGRVGGQIVIYSHRLKEASFKELLPLGSLTRLEFKLGGAKLTVLGTYWPANSGAKKGLEWRLRENGCAEPIPTLKRVITTQVNNATADARAVILCGDFNTDIWATDKYDLRGVMDEMFIYDTSTVHGASTYKRGTSHTCIDYILAAGPLTTLNSFPLSMNGIFTDHCPMFLRATVDCYAPVNTMKPKALQLRGDVDRKDLKRVAKIEAAYGEMLATVDLEAPDEEVLQDLGDESVRIALDIRRKRNRPDGWSPKVMALVLALENMCRMKRASRRCADAKVHGGTLDYPGRVALIRREWSSNLRSLGRNGPGAVTFDDLKNYEAYSYNWWQGRSEATMLLVVDHAISATRKLLHSRYRKDERKLISMRVYRRQKHYEANRIKKVLDSVNGTTRSGYSMETLVVGGEVLVDPEAIAALNRDFFEAWFRDDSASESDPALDEWKRWEHWGNHDLDEFLRRQQHTCIPVGILEVLHRALTKRNGTELQRATFAIDILRMPNFEEFAGAVAHMKNDSAAGISGLSYNMMKLWPREVVEVVYAKLERMWRDRTIPEYWKWRFLVPIPKTPGAELKDTRPLVLMEALRKVWETIFARRIQSYLLETGVLHGNQHAYLRGKSTETAAVQLLHALETAKEQKTKAYLSTWDMKRAFDSVAKSVLIYSWVRLGIPEELAVYLVSMDIGGHIIVRTPQALGDVTTDLQEALVKHGFVADLGTGQGGVNSALNWDAFADILVCALDDPYTDEEKAIIAGDRSRLRIGSFVYLDGHHFGIPVPDVAFADDLMSLQSSLFGLQRKADIVSAFCIIFKMTLSLTKFRAYEILWGHTGARDDQAVKSIVIHVTDWSDTNIVSVPLARDGHFKHLGITWDLDVTNNTQFQQTVALIKKTLGVIRARRASAEIKWLALQKSLYPKISYYAKFCPWSTVQLQKLDDLVSSFLCLITGNMASFPHMLLYVPKDMGGLGFERLSSHINTCKEGMMHRLVGASETVYARVMMGLVRRGIEQRNGIRNLGASSNTLPIGGPARKPLTVWATSLLDWYDHCNIQLTINPLYELVANTTGNCMPVGLARDASCSPLSCEHHTTLLELGIEQMGELFVAGDNINQLQEAGLAWAPMYGCRVSAEIEIRVGQCWATQARNKVVEIVAFLRPSGDSPVLAWQVSYIAWQPADAAMVAQGVTLRISHDDYTDGAAGTHTVPMATFLQHSQLLVTTTPETIRGEFYQRQVALVRSRTPTLTMRDQIDLPPETDLSGVTRLTTDGSWTQAGTTVDHLTGMLTTTCAAAVVLQKGDIFVGAIKIDCDGSTHKSAYSVEVVGLAYAAKLSMDAEILSDCQSALKLCQQSSHGKCPNTPMAHILASGIRDRARNMRWTKAHPERRKTIANFTSDERSIYAADLLAGGNLVEFSKFTGIPIAAIQTTTDHKVLESYVRQTQLMIADSEGRAVLESTRMREKRLDLEQYQRGRRRPQFANGTPLFGAMMRQPAKTIKLTYNGQRSRAQWVRIMWDKHFTGDAQKRYGTSSSGGCNCCMTGQLETQTHILLECSAGSIPLLRRSAVRHMSAFVTRLTRQSHPHANILAKLREIAVSEDGAQLWTGMLSPPMRRRLSDLTQFVPPGPETAQLNALIHNMCRPLATGAADIYTERCRLLSEKNRAQDAPPSEPTQPTDFDAALRAAAAAVRRKKLARKKKLDQLSSAAQAKIAPRSNNKKPVATLHRWFRRRVIADDDDDNNNNDSNTSRTTRHPPISNTLRPTDQSLDDGCTTDCDVFPDALRGDLYDVDAVDIVGDIHNSSATTNTAPNNVVSVTGERHTKKRRRASALCDTEDTAPTRRRRIAEARHAIMLTGVRAIDTYFTRTVSSCLDGDKGEG